MKKPLSKMIKTFYGISDFGFSFMVTGLENSYLLFFMTNVAKFPLASISIVTTISAIIDAFMQPVYGGIIAGMKPMKWGRNRSWFVFMPILVMLTFIMMFTDIGPKNVGVIIVGVSLCLTNATRTFSWLSHVNLISVLANNSNERALLASRRATWNSVGGALSSYAVLPLITFFAAVLKNDVSGYTIVATLMALIYVGFTWFTLYFTKGYEPTGADAVQTPATKVTFKDMVHSALGNPSLLLLVVADFFKYLAGFLMSASAVYYFTYIAGNLALTPLYILLRSVMTTIGSASTGLIAKKLSTKGSAVLGSVCQGILLIICGFFARNVVAFFILIMAAHIFTGVCNPAMTALYTDCSVYSEWKTGKNASPFIMGTMTFALKFSYIFRASTVTAILAMVGFSAGIDPALATDALKNGIIAAYLFIPAGALLLSGALLSFGYRLTRAKVDELQEEINARKAAAAV